MAQIDKKRIISQTTTLIADKETGEVLSNTQENIIYLPSEPSYIKLYLEDITKLNGLPKGCTDLMRCLLRKMDYDGVITLSSTSKERISEQINIKVQSINNSIQMLVKKDIMTRCGRGEYMFNPNYFAKGDWKSIYKQRDKYMELKITYKENGEREIKGQLRDIADK